MAIPIILAGAALAAGAFGVKKGLDAKADFDIAKDVNDEARSTYDSAERSLRRSREAAQKSLDSLGKLKFELYEQKLIPFVDAFNKIKNIDFQRDGIEDILHPGQGRQDLKSLEEITLRMRDIVSGGIGALGAGGLAGLATYGSVGLLASTAGGTAIGTLSGVAATNATLAWLGGGSLAAGGLGMAGGAYVLGGIVAGPVLAIGGMMLASKAEEAKENAYSNRSMAKKAAEEMSLAKTATDGMRAHFMEIENTLEALRDVFDPLLEGLKSLVAFSRKDWSGMIDYSSLSEEDKKGVMMSFSSAVTIKNLIEVAVFDEKGLITEASKTAIQEAQLALEH